jgi:AcrR family transcriptional regulator
MKKSVDLQRRRPQQARARATVDSILEAAIQVLERSGVDGLNTNSVAERAGVSIGTLYQYFPDKDAILVAMARRELAGTHVEAVAPQRRLLEALVRALESLLGGGAARRARASRTGGRSAVARRVASQVEEFVRGWLIVPVFLPIPVRAASQRLLHPRARP